MTPTLIEGSVTFLYNLWLPCRNYHHDFSMKSLILIFWERGDISAVLFRVSKMFHIKACSYNSVNQKSFSCFEAFFQTRNFSWHLRQNYRTSSDKCLTLLYRVNKLKIKNEKKTIFFPYHHVSS